MKELEKFLNVEAEWVLERLSTGTESNDRNYYQGRLDQLAQVRRFLGQPQMMREKFVEDGVPCYVCENEIELDDSVWADSTGEVNNPLYAYCVPCLPNQKKGK